MGNEHNPQTSSIGVWNDIRNKMFQRGKAFGDGSNKHECFGLNMHERPLYVILACLGALMITVNGHSITWHSAFASSDWD